MINILDYTGKNVIYIGDIHGCFSTMEYDLHDVKHIKDSIIIVCGDIGLGFKSPNQDKNDIGHLNKKLMQNNNHIFLFRGNHDDPYMFNIDSKWRIDTEKMYHNVHIIPDYSILKTNDGNILIIGGARSIDRTNRILNRSYWADEMVEDMPDNFINDLKSLNINIDIICTHTAPLFAQPIDKDIAYQGEMVENWSFYDKTLKVDNWNERLKLVNIFNDLTKNNFDIKYWIYGHFHNHFETQYNNVLLIGLDMCYSSKWRNRNNDEYKLYNDIFYINGSEKKGNIFKTN